METAIKRKSTGRKWLAFLLVTVGVAAAAYMFLLNNAAHATTELGKSWPAGQRLSMDDIDHSSLDELLKKYVDQDGYVDYSAWKASQADRELLRRYFDTLSHADREIPASRESRLAFWINAYNAVTLEGILRVYPTESIRDHTSMLGGYNIWKHLPLRVGDSAFSLEQIEHEILRPMGEPRVHFAIVCASVGCPRLMNRAYTADKLGKQLTVNTRDFFSRGQNLRVDAAADTIFLSSILSWFGQDFGQTQSERLKFLAPYFPGEAAVIARKPGIDIEYLDYDWSLNDQSRRG